MMKNNIHTHCFTSTYIFIIGISSNGSDDSPYSWTEKPFHPYTDRYKNAPVCKTSPQSETATNIVIRYIRYLCHVLQKLGTRIYYGLYMLTGMSGTCISHAK